MTPETKVRGTCLAVGDVGSDRLLRMHRLWRERAGERRWPAPQDLPLADVAFMQGTVTLVEVMRDPLRFRLALLGPVIEELRGRGDQGKMVDDIQPPYYAALLKRHYAEAVSEGAPMFHLIQFVPGARPPIFPLAYERVILPLSCDGAVIDTLMIGSDWSESITSELRRFHESK